ncbi:helix-turn-helix domain-containing protein [Exilibacterium tricleocarpae]|uniref:Helix-turn-helix domain-containing protein n=1 Tax=Exilibacterium tricleocarpae TaxID=2591008 RepID=A0A545T8N1_9GAMM|nr:helix-turn-helix domain-containing protein [Exilibacterium tricleocarpae]TQV73561.1 helix-turn-helix domain-containing protein [Exilibacterium tricleocarpae]
MDVGARLQILRTLNGWSQRELAKRAGVTNSTISMIEQGRVSPSVSSLQKVLDGIPMSLRDFFTLNLDADTQVFYDAADFRDVGNGSVAYHLLGANRPGRAMSIKQARFPPGSDTGPEVLISDGDEGGIVVEGQIEAMAAGEVRLLNTGDGYYFESRRPHRFRNTGRRDCVMIIATSRAF